MCEYSELERVVSEDVVGDDELAVCRKMKIKRLKSTKRDAVSGIACYVHGEWLRGLRSSTSSVLIDLPSSRVLPSWQEAGFRYLRRLRHPIRSCFSETFLCPSVDDGSFWSHPHSPEGMFQPRSG